MCCEGKEVDFKELKSPEMEALQKALFPGIISLLQGGPQAPGFQINAPNDPNMAAGMNMFREMGGMQPNYTPWQAPQFFDPSWMPNWGNFPGYGGGGSGGSSGSGSGGRESGGDYQDEDRSESPGKRLRVRPPKKI